MPQGVRAGLSVHWREIGKGSAPALMLHCALASGAAWAPLAKRLGARLRMVAPDMPGHGQSGDLDPDRDMHDQVSQMAESFVVPGCHLIGHSFGATVALRLAQQHPARVRSLVLIEPVLFAAARARAPRAFAAHRERSAAYRCALERGDFEAAARAFTLQWGDGTDWNSLSARQREGFIQRIGIVAQTDGCLNGDTAGLLAPGRLERIEAPVLMLRGERTEAIVPEIHACLRARLRDVREAVVPGAAHMLPVTHAVRVGAEIDGFLDKT